VTLLAFAAERRAAGRPPLSIDISRPPGPQQQTHGMPLLWCNMGQAERQTDGHRIVTLTPWHTM